MTVNATQPRNICNMNQKSINKYLVIYMAYESVNSHTLINRFYM